MPPAPVTIPPVSWKINREFVVLLGWTPSVLMQLAHPLVAAAVANHSSFVNEQRQRARRLHRTVRAMLALTFGTPEEVRATVAAINSLHDRINGRLDRTLGAFDEGSEYSAHDPELLRWVHATLLDCVLRTYDAYVGALSPEEQEAYCEGAAAMGPLLGAPEGFFPRSVAELRAYVDEMLDSSVIQVTEPARSVAREILSPSFTRGIWPVMAFGRLSARWLLPPQLRAAYGFTWTPRDERAARLSAAVIRSVLPAVPSLLRHWPAARRAERGTCWH